MEKRISKRKAADFFRFAPVSSASEHVIFCFLKCSSKPYIVPDDGRVYLFRGVKAAFWRAQDAFLPEFVCFKRAINVCDWRLKHKLIMAALTFLHVIMVINQLNAKFAAAFPMRSRIFDAFRRIRK